jgi:hypothetical protein
MLPPFVLQAKQQQFWRPINTSRPNEFGASPPPRQITSEIIALLASSFVFCSSNPNQMIWTFYTSIFVPNGVI